MSEPSNVFTDGAAYERIMGRWSRQVGRDFLDWLAPAAGLDWLDVGCGNGAFTEELIARSAPASVQALDPSEEQLAYARTRSGVRLAKFQRGDAQSLPFDDASFDMAVMALVIAFVPDPDRAIAEMLRVVRPGGQVATYMWDIPGGGVPVNPIYDAMKALGLGVPLPPNPGISRMAALEGLWRTAGLEAVEGRVIEITVSYPDFDDFWETNSLPVGPQGKAIQAMSPDAREALRRRVAEDLPAAPDGGIAFKAFANAVKGRNGPHRSPRDA